MGLKRKRRSLMEPAEHADRSDRRFFMVGGGIAGLAAAAFLVRDGGISGDQIHVFEQDSLLGGSLDGQGSPDTGYLIRGGRMFEPHFVCTYDLFQSIPTLEHPDRSVTQEIQEFNRRVVTSSRCRLVSNGKRIEAPPLELSLRDRWDIARLIFCREARLGTLKIEDHFAPDFFQTNFWYMWCTMFAFQPWHSLKECRRYMRRFVHLLPGFNCLEGICRTRLNQYDSLIRPLVHWLTNSGVSFHLDTAVVDLEWECCGDQRRISGLRCRSSNAMKTQGVGEYDGVVLTLGSMTDRSSLGTMTEPPAQRSAASDGAWALWQQVSQESASFGQPEVFSGDVSRTNWESFTVTLTSPEFFEFMERFTGNSAGTGGLVTFKDSSWLMSVVLAHQPHFENQPERTNVFWGYGLFPDREGDCIRKPMSECSGRELLDELSFHLRLGSRAASMFADAVCIPCMLPFITSQFMPRDTGDRPLVRPPGAVNFAFVGQFCELPEDVVFTVEYSIRSARTAVYSLLNLGRRIPPVYQGLRNPAVALRAALALSR